MHRIGYRIQQMFNFHYTFFASQHILLKRLLNLEEQKDQACLLLALFSFYLIGSRIPKNDGSKQGDIPSFTPTCDRLYSRYIAHARASTTLVISRHDSIKTIDNVQIHYVNSIYFSGFSSTKLRLFPLFVLLAS